MTRKRTQAFVKRSLFSDIRRMIEEARSAVAVTVNPGLTILYWQIGTRIRKDILQEKRADYGGEFCRHCQQNWSRSSGEDLERKTSGEWRSRGGVP